MAKKTPLRQCIGCQEMIAKKDMLRIIKTPEGDICLDPSGKKNGRGAYICFSKDCLNKAIKSKALDRTFKTGIPEDVYENLKEELTKLETK